MVCGSEHKVCKLKKALYGLKHAPQAWNKCIHAYFMDHGFHKSSVESTLYVLVQGKDVVMVVLFVDDIILTGNNIERVNAVKEDLERNFEITDMGFLHYFLGIEFMHTNEGIYMSQHKYVMHMLKRFNMLECKPLTTPMQTRHTLELCDEEEDADATLYR